MKDYDVELPEATEFLELSAHHQDECAIRSRQTLMQLLSKAWNTYTKLGTVLSFADRFASCFWGCHGREHVIESLVGRTTSSARAAIRLIEFGHYDEALALTRNIGEIGNLMHLFFTSPSEIRRWLDLPKKKQRSEFAPMEVRKALERLGSIVPYDQSSYSKLSEVAIHPNPSTKPQTHNLYTIPTLGGFYQEKGQVVCINELAWAVATVVGPAAKIAILDRSKAEAIVQATIELVESIDTQEEDTQEITGSSDCLFTKSIWVDCNL